MNCLKVYDNNIIDELVTPPITLRITRRSGHPSVVERIFNNLYQSLLRPESMFPHGDRLMSLTSEISTPFIRKTLKFIRAMRSWGIQEEYRTFNQPFLVFPMTRLFPLKVQTRTSGRSWTQPLNTNRYHLHKWRLSSTCSRWSYMYSSGSVVT